MKRLRVTLIGSGNVAYHLSKAWQKSQTVELVELYHRTPLSPEFEELAIPTINKLSELSDSEIYIISVKDDAISEISEKLPFTNQLVVHTAGSITMRAMNNRNRRGVFYPLQSFSKQIPIDFSQVPFCIEAENISDKQTLEYLAKSLSQNVYHIDSQKRKLLHVAAIFSNNFSNYMQTLAYQICTENDLPTEILTPLIKTTFNKISKMTPYEAQTGPARRNDSETINSHLNLLNGNVKDIYQIISNSITKLYEKEKL